MANCDYCGVKLSKNRKRFCSNKHKDKFHNKSNPRGWYSALNHNMNSMNNVGWNFDDMDGHFSNEDN